MFGKGKPGENVSPSYIFEENGFEIFGIDIKKIEPEDAEIAAQLNNAIKSNMDVYVQKIEQTARLEAERQLIAGKIEIEKTKGDLIKLEQENLRKEQLGVAKIDAEAVIEKARGEAEAIHIKRSAEAEADYEKATKLITALKAEGGESYIRLQQVLSFMNVEKTVIVPTDSKLFVPMGNIDSTSKISRMLDDEEEEL